MAHIEGESAHIYPIEFFVKNGDLTITLEGNGLITSLS